MHIFENFVNQPPILHYTLVIDFCTNLQRILNKIVVDTGLSKWHIEDVHYINAKEHQSSLVKNVTMDCIQTILKHTIFLKYSEYKCLYNSFCINVVFVVVCINNFVIKTILMLFYDKPTGTLLPLVPT